MNIFRSKPIYVNPQGANEEILTTSLFNDSKVFNSNAPGLEYRMESSGQLINPRSIVVKEHLDAFSSIDITFSSDF